MKFWVIICQIMHPKKFIPSLFSCEFLRGKEESDFTCLATCTFYMFIVSCNYEFLQHWDQMEQKGSKSQPEILLTWVEKHTKIRGGLKTHKKRMGKVV